MELECKEYLLTWYQTNKITADRTINDPKKQLFEAMMHLYAYVMRDIVPFRATPPEGSPIIMRISFETGWTMKRENRTN